MNNVKMVYVSSKRSRCHGNMCITPHLSYPHFGKDGGVLSRQLHEPVHVHLTCTGNTPQLLFHDCRSTCQRRTFMSHCCLVKSKKDPNTKVSQDKMDCPNVLEPVSTFPEDDMLLLVIQCHVRSSIYSLLAPGANICQASAWAKSTTWEQKRPKTIRRQHQQSLDGY